AAALLLTPEISIGLFGMTPDLPLILLWYAALAFAALALRSEPGSARALAFVLGAAFAAGLACDAKASGALLLVGLVATFAQPLARPHLRTLAPWAGLALVLVLVAPVVIDEVERGLPMLRHRLIDTQRGSGLSVRNLGALFGGQLLYVTPPLLYAAYLVARDLYRRRSDDAVSSLIFCVTAATTPLVVLACLSRVAEPHWVAPLYLALPLHLARIAERTPKLLSPVVTGLATAIGVATIAVAHAAVLLPLAPRWLGARYEPRYDLANDLFAWRTGLPLVRRALLVTLAPGAPPPVVVGPHWTVCAQLHAALPASVLVGCSGEIPDDFSRWLPPSLWQEAPVVLLVSDDRFDRASSSMRGRRLDAAWHVDVERGGRAVRRITVERWVATATASR
ncbi:MAG TPA: glycosyltransferase family 39 protein, partial [Polyangiaceae bacterium]|nr:glycosyltransferase family 39 protein [Polyangiaceae bacterium]